MGISSWDISDRPREKLLARGAQSLTDAELLAIFLRTGVAGKSAVALAQDALTQTGGLRALLHVDQTQFCQIRGMGLAKYVQLRATVEIALRYLNEPLQRGETLSNSPAVTNFLRAKLRQHPHETIAALFLNSQHQLIAYEELFHGTINRSDLHPRRLVQRCFHHNAAAIILAHNHPSGNPQPSTADIRLTHRLNTILEPLDIKLVDHIIIGDKSTVSLANWGVLPE